VVIGSPGTGCEVVRAIVREVLLGGGDAIITNNETLGLHNRRDAVATSAAEAVTNSYRVLLPLSVAGRWRPLTTRCCKRKMRCSVSFLGRQSNDMPQATGDVEECLC
jgi:hypothetical protein